MSPFRLLEVSNRKKLSQEDNFLNTKTNNLIKESIHQRLLETEKKTKTTTHSVHYLLSKLRT